MPFKCFLVSPLAVKMQRPFCYLIQKPVIHCSINAYRHIINAAICIPPNISVLVSIRAHIIMIIITINKRTRCQHRQFFVWIHDNPIETFLFQKPVHRIQCDFYVQYESIKLLAFRIRWHSRARSFHFPWYWYSFQELHRLPLDSRFPFFPHHIYSKLCIIANMRPNFV